MTDSDVPHPAAEQLATIHSWPQTEGPVMVMCLEGWIDAGSAATNAVGHLLAAMPHDLVASFDSDELIDYRARRPILRIVNGVHKELRWAQIRLHSATNRTGRTVLVLNGPEPDMRWHRFTSEVIGLASRLGVELVVGLGGFPAPVPHTRPVRLVGTSTDAELAARVGYLPASIDVPSGVQGALEMAFGQAGIPAVGLWARVPHYVAAMPYPAASAALLEGLARMAEIEIDVSALLGAAATTGQQIAQLIAASEEHTAMVRQLEVQHDSEQPAEPLSSLGDLPSGDELAAELERFLRGER
ncbi:MAG: PAC2 family protein [Acidimicrobiales bacterium]|nr:PAC2 family protein [Acidimicrobiales bacterium]